VLLGHGPSSDTRSERPLGIATGLHHGHGGKGGVGEAADGVAAPLAGGRCGGLVAGQVEGVDDGADRLARRGRRAVPENLVMIALPFSFFLWSGWSGQGTGWTGVPARTADPKAVTKKKSRPSQLTGELVGLGTWPAEACPWLCRLSYAPTGGGTRTRTRWLRRNPCLRNRPTTVKVRTTTEASIAASPGFEPGPPGSEPGVVPVPPPRKDLD
jgi:hypothetical protein